MLATGLAIIAVQVLDAPSAAAQDGQVTFTITKDAPGSTEPFPFMHFESGESFTLADDESWSRSVPVNGFVELESYDIAGWRASSLNCTGATSFALYPDPFVNYMFIEVADTDVDCTVTSEPVPMVSVSITKIAPGSDGSDAFDFQISDSNVLNFWDFTLVDGESYTFSAPAFESLYLYEYAPGWVLSDISCVGADALVYSETDAEILLLDADASCTVINAAPVPVSVRITKEAIGGVGDEVFTWFDNNTGLTAFVADGESQTYEVVANSTVSINETLPVDWRAEGLVCDGSETFASVFEFPSGVRLEVGVGSQPVDCVLTNVYDPVATTEVTITTLIDGAEPATVTYWASTGESFDVVDGESFTIATVEGDYLFLQTAHPSTLLASGFDCTGTSDSSFFSDPGFSYFQILVGSEPIDCTVTFAEQPQVLLTITNSADGSDGMLFGYDWFDFIGGGGGFFELADGESITIEVPAFSGLELQGTTVPGFGLNEVICEGATVNYVFNDPSMAFAGLSIGEGDASCTLIHRPPPVLRITKRVEGPPTDVRFNFGSVNGPFTLGAAESTDISVYGERIIVTELVPADWQLSAIDCDVDSASLFIFVPEPDSGLSFGFVDLAYPTDRDLVECVFTNRPRAGHITIEAVVPTAAPSSLDLSIAGPDGVISLGDGESFVVEVLDTGDVEFTAELNGRSGWRISGWSCVDVDGSSHTATVARNAAAAELAVSTGPGIDVTCTIVVGHPSCNAPGRAETTNGCRRGPR